jgi:hypothetical protein
MKLWIEGENDRMMDRVETMSWWNVEYSLGWKTMDWGLHDWIGLTCQTEGFGVSARRNDFTRTFFHFSLIDHHSGL